LDEKGINPETGVILSITTKKWKKVRQDEIKRVLYSSYRSPTVGKKEVNLYKSEFERKDLQETAIAG